MKTNLNTKSGFTLVELAIVLVIIGLIIGGVLVGQDLIKAATIRTAITDVEKFNAASTTFRGKYNGLPGDLAAAKAVEFGLSPAATNNAAGTDGARDGNGAIEGGPGTPTLLGGEAALFWQDLGATGLIGGQYTAIGVAVSPAAAVAAGAINTYLPRSKLRDSASYHVYSATGRNSIFLASMTAPAAGGVVASTSAVSPLEAKGIDEKLDDGAPFTGIALSFGAVLTAPPVAANATAGSGAPPAANATTECVTTGSVYNVSSAATGGPANVNCQMLIRSSF
jgi:prepilin-type N-terminal cleavage/methylation domain-containing protein